MIIENDLMERKRGGEARDVRNVGEDAGSRGRKEAKIKRCVREKGREPLAKRANRGARRTGNKIEGRKTVRLTQIAADTKGDTGARRGNGRKERRKLNKAASANCGDNRGRSRRNRIDRVVVAKRRIREDGRRSSSRSQRRERRERRDGRRNGGERRGWRSGKERTER